MKLKELTKEQRASIEADEFGRGLILFINSHNSSRDGEIKSIKYDLVRLMKKEVERTIKRIDDERIFLQNVEIPRYTYSGEVRDLKIFYFDEIKKRIKELIQQKQLYELMEQLE